MLNSREKIGIQRSHSFNVSPVKKYFKKNFALENNIHKYFKYSEINSLQNINKTRFNKISLKDIQNESSSKKSVTDNLPIYGKK
jgi:hypothetical protein